MDRIVLEPNECDICPTHAIMAIFKTNHPNNYHRLCTQCKDDLERRATLSIGKTSSACILSRSNSVLCAGNLKED